jgi:uncharacterized protein
MVVVLSGFLSFAGHARADDSRQVLLRPQAAKLPPTTIEHWAEECRSKGTPVACYNVAVDYAQSEGDEPKALAYLRPLCKNAYGLGCFNLGGILIKETTTRQEGLAALRMACSLSKTDAGSGEERVAYGSACEIAAVVTQHMTGDYMEIAEVLGLIPKFGPATFDCAKATTRVESMICGDRYAADLDGRAGSYYGTALAISEHPDQLKAEQHSWLATQRDQCPDIVCVRRAYERRFEILRALNEPAGTAPPPLPVNDPYPASFVRAPFVKPGVVEELAESQVIDGSHARRVVAIDLSKPKEVRTNLGEATTTKRDGDTIPYVYEDEPVDDPADISSFGPPSFGYQWIGRTTSGVDVLLLRESGGGSGVFESVLMLKVQLDPARATRLLIKRIRQEGLGDRWEGDLRVIGNNVVIGCNTGRFAEESCRYRRVIKIP